MIEDVEWGKMNVVNRLIDGGEVTIARGAQGKVLRMGRNGSEAQCDSETAAAGSNSPSRMKVD